MVEQWTENPRVGSSILPLGTSLFVINGVWRSWLARLVWDQKAGGSSPLTPTIFRLRKMVRHSFSEGGLREDNLLFDYHRLRVAQPLIN